MKISFFERINKMSFSVEAKAHLIDLETFAELNFKVKEMRLEYILGKPGFHYVTTELFEPITKNSNYSSGTLHLIS